MASSSSGPPPPTGGGTGRENNKTRVNTSFHSNSKNTNNSTNGIDNNTSTGSCATDLKVVGGTGNSKNYSSGTSTSSGGIGAKNSRNRSGRNRSKGIKQSQNQKLQQGGPLSRGGTSKVGPGGGPMTHLSNKETAGTNASGTSSSRQMQLPSGNAGKPNHSKGGGKQPQHKEVQGINRSNGKKQQSNVVISRTSTANHQEGKRNSAVPSTVPAAGLGPGSKKKRNRSRKNKNVNDPEVLKTKSRSAATLAGKRKKAAEEKAAAAAAAILKAKVEAEERAEVERLLKIQKEREARRAMRIQVRKKRESQIEETCQRLDQLIIDTTAYHLKTRFSLSERELEISRKKFQLEKKNLVSDLKKCTAFCKKIKSTQTWELPLKGCAGGGPSVVNTMLKDVKTLNLTRYMEEIAAAFLESKLKVSDIPGVVCICVALHERYKEFGDIFIHLLMNAIQGGGGESSDPKHKRISLRILTEFLLTGITQDAKPIVRIVNDASGAGNGYNVTDPMLVVSFAKAAGHEIFGILPKSLEIDLDFLKVEIDVYETQKDSAVNDLSVTEYTSGKIVDEEKEDVESEEEVKCNQDSAKCVTYVENQSINDENDPSLEEMQKFREKKEELEDYNLDAISSGVIEKANIAIDQVNNAKEQRAVSREVCVTLRSHVIGTFDALCKSYLTTHKKLVKLEKRCEQDRLLAGSISEQREKGLADANKLLESLRKSVEALAEALHRDLPQLKEDDDAAIAAADEGTGVELYKEDERDAILGPFDDEETRAFYCDIPDLLTTIPPALLGYTLEDVEKIQAVNVQKYGSGFDVTNGGGDDTSNETEVISKDEIASVEEIEVDVAASAETIDVEKEKKGKDTTEESEENKDTPHYKLMLLIEQELPECNRRELIDELAEKFCVNHGASKNSRKRLQKALFLVPRSRLDLLPYYARFAGILDRVFPDVAASLVTELEQQFHGLARFKKQQSIDSRLRNARFLGELTKFRVAPPIVALRCIRRCLEDFSGYNIDVACCTLESCGRYLHRTKHTQQKLTTLMDTIDRIRKVKNFDERSVAVINSAFFMVIPPLSVSRKEAKILPPLEAYLKNLFMDRLVPDEKVISFVSKQLLRLPWSDPSKECGLMIAKYMLKACRKGRYETISAVSSVVASIKKAKPEVLARIVDMVLEELQYSLEHPSISGQQRTLVFARLLGQLHSHALVASTIIFDKLYNFVNFGHDIPDALFEASVKQLSHHSLNDNKSATISSTVLKGPSGINQTIIEEEEMEVNDEDETNDEESQVLPPVAVSLHSKFDPRVPCALDPPSAVFRIKLTCTLLESSASSLVTSSNMAKLETFLYAFQRYLFTKLTLPTDIEFSLLDTFDILDSKFKEVEKESRKSNITSCIVRSKTWLDAHNATVAKEEADALAEERAETRLLLQAGVKNMTTDIDGVSVNNDDSEDNLNVSDEEDSLDDALSLNSDDGSESAEEYGDDDTFGNQSENDSLVDVMSDEEEGSDDDSKEDEDVEDDEDIYDDEEEIDERAAQDAHMQKLEEEAFERELRRITLDALEKGKVAARTGANAKVSDAMPTASQFIRKKSLECGSNVDTDDGAPQVTLGGGAGMTFKLLKRGHKGRVEAKQLVVPTDTNLAKVATKQDDEAAKERDMLKARVLRYEAESAEQAYSGDVYSDQTKLPRVRNRPLSMEDIDRNFGNTGGEYNRRANALISRDGTDRPRSSQLYGGRGGGRLYDAERGGRSGR